VRLAILLCVAVLLSTLALARSSNAATPDQLNETGIAQYKSAHLDDALSTFVKALDIYKLRDNSKGVATALTEISMCYEGFGQSQTALDYLEQALLKWRQIGDRDYEASTLGREGDVYRAWGFPDLAIRRYRQALRLFLIAGDRSGTAAVLNNIGLAYLDLGKRKQARLNFDTSLELYNSLHDAGGPGDRDDQHWHDSHPNA
jgi:tetratricopeptide (TPR) repeat protein